MMAGAYTLSRNGHDARRLPLPKLAAASAGPMDLALYILFFFPGILALIYSGWGFAYFSWMLNERSSFSPDGPIIWPFKFLIPITGVLSSSRGWWRRRAA
jgi:TRAP-type mannitol/chloroaromatic compound transport system permease small subunit